MQNGNLINTVYKQGSHSKGRGTDLLWNAQKTVDLPDNCCDGTKAHLETRKSILLLLLLVLVGCMVFHASQFMPVPTEK
jgi:hypothetical protein